MATAAVVAVFWTSTWLLGQPTRPGASALAAVAVALPTVMVTSLTVRQRIRDSLRRSLAPPRASLHETPAASRDRRARLSGAVLTGIIILLLFDRFSGGGGIMAGLIAGLLGALGALDWLESHQWAAAERERSSRIFVIVKPDALSPRLPASDVYELSRPGHDSRHAPGPFDLEI